MVTWRGYGRRCRSSDVLGRAVGQRVCPILLQSFIQTWEAGQKETLKSKEQAAETE